MRDNILVIAGVTFVLFLLGISPIIHFTTLDTKENVIILDKERVTSGVGDNVTSKYLIFTEGETFQNTDTIWEFKFNSSDIYGKIQKGQLCKFELTGFRVSFLSMYRNILSAECKSNL
jgi:hypothetical protein